MHLSKNPVHGAELVLGREDLPDLPLDGLGDVVHVLRLDDGLQVVLQDAREVVLQLRPPEVLQDFLPVGRALESPQVGLELPRQDFEGR